MGTISTEKSVLGYPMVNVIAMADSPKGENSTGAIYFLLTDLDFTGQDLKAQNKVMAFFSMEQYKHCSDPMEPTCARVMIAGQMVKLTEGTDEYTFGNRSMFSRHPNAKNWVESKSHLDHQPLIKLTKHCLFSLALLPSNARLDCYQQPIHSISANWT